MNIPPTKRKDPKPTPYKWEGNYAYLCVRSLGVVVQNPPLLALVVCSVEK
jgi:hypothetical protein